MQPGVEGLHQRHGDVAGIPATVAADTGLAAEGVAVAGFLDVHPRRIGGQKRGRPVWPVERLEREPSAFVLAAVGSAGARPRIRAFMARLGRDEGEDYLFVA